MQGEEGEGSWKVGRGRALTKASQASSCQDEEPAECVSEMVSYLKQEMRKSSPERAVRCVEEYFNLTQRLVAGGEDVVTIFLASTLESRREFVLFTRGYHPATSGRGRHKMDREVV